MTPVQKKLAYLRARVEVPLPPSIAERPFLSPARRFFAGLGLVRVPKLVNLGLFAGGGIALIVGFGIISELSSGISSAKRILGETTVGFEYLRGRDLIAARLQFAKIETDIRSSNLGFVAGSIPEISSHLLSAMEILEKDGGPLSGLRIGWDSAANASSEDFYYRLTATRHSLVRAASELIQAEGLANAMPAGLLPESLQAEVQTGLGLLTSVRATLEKAADASGLLLSLMEGEGKTYLLIFQNNDEGRATGGFIGTYGFVDLGNGQIKLTKIESIYEPDGQLKEQIAAPGPLQRQATTLWGMRDSNWFADFPSSSRKTLEFLEKETGVLANGVISFTPDVFESLLEITGPVEMPEYGVTLTAENFRETIQRKTSLEYDRELNQPKKFLADFAPLLLSRLSELGESQRLTLAAALGSAVSEKQLMLFSLDSALESKIKKYGAGGEMRETHGDYLSIIHSNVGGGKTDQSMAQSVQKSVMIDEFGRQVSTLRITRANNSVSELYFPTNLDFMRVFVPEGAKLLHASGFDSLPLPPSASAGLETDSDLAFWDSQIRRDWDTGIYIGREAGKTVFMGWLAVAPGQTKTVELSYSLPHMGTDYTLLLQKQPGAKEFIFDLNVNIPGREAVYQYPENFGESAVAEDRFYAVIAR